MALEVASHQAEGYEVALLLIQDAVYKLVGDDPTSRGLKYALSDDLEARNISAPPHPASKVDYEEVVRLIFEYDTVIVW